MLNAPLPPDITVTDHLQRIISEWKGAVGHRLDRLFQDCLDLVGSEKQLLPRRIIPVHELDGSTLQRALKRFSFPLNYAVDTVGRFEAALIPILRENDPAVGFLFAYEEDLPLQDQVALFAHAVGHLILNDQVRLKGLELPLNPDDGEIHTDRLSELRYLDISRNRNFLDRQVLEAFPRLTRLIEPPEESQILLERSTRDPSINRCIRAWLLSTEQFRRVGEDYWILNELLPPEVKRTRLQVLPIRGSAAEAQQHLREGGQSAEAIHGELERRREQIILKGTATKAQVIWIATLRSIHLTEGFIPIPKAIRGIYPPLLPGEEHISVVHGIWYDDADEMWIWLDRVHHRLYGPDLLNKIGFFSAGIKLRIEWNGDGLVLREEGHDQEVLKEETRLVDLEELKQLRGGLGEGYRQTIQGLLLAAPEGLTFKELVIALRAKQQHEVPRSTVRSILASGEFIQWQQRWYAATDAQSGAKKLKEALLETLVPQAPEDALIVLSHQEYVRIRVVAIQRRLQEITSMLRENVND